MKLSVAIAGCTGYAGGEAVRLLLGHPDVEIGNLTAGGSAGTKFGQHHPNLLPLVDRVVLETTAENLSGHDVVILALPHGASAAIAADLPSDALVLDCGADYRLTDAAVWQQFYGTEHAGSWPYGLPELPGQREVLAATRRVAVPGCYPTTVTLSMLPALAHGLIDGADVTAAAASGTSGAGKAAKPNLLAAELMGSMSAYGVGGVHRHVPEVLQNFAVLGAQAPTVSFTPMLAPMTRGILAVCTAPIADDISVADLREAYAESYGAEPFAHLLPEGTWPASKQVQGSNGFLVQVTIDRAVGRMVAVGTLDNLTKGTAGAAVQCMNLASGLEETTGLAMMGVAP